MKKHSTKNPRNPRDTQPGDVGHLEETLTEITATTAQRIKAWRKPLLLGLVAIAIVFAGYSAVSWFLENRERGLNARLYTLVQAPAAMSEDYAPPRSEVDALLADAKGKNVERAAYKTLVEFYLDRAAKLVEKAKLPAEGAPTGTPAAATPAIGLEEARDRALELSAAAAQRFPEDRDIQSWAQAVRTKVEGERKTSWMPARWKYAPPPAVTPPAPAETAPGGGAAEPPK